MSWVYEAKGMYELRSRSRSNEEALHVVRSDLPKQEKLVAEAQKALAQASKAPEAIDVVTTELKARTAKLKKLQCRLGKIDSESERLEAELKNLEACYAEAEVFKLIRSRNYRLTPITFANVSQSPTSTEEMDSQVC
jgi:septal ring factor EnvC (AmiA/AmiB activator)